MYIYVHVYVYVYIYFELWSFGSKTHESPGFSLTSDLNGSIDSATDFCLLVFGVSLWQK